MPRFAAVLPPREGFGPGRSGAIGLLVHSLAAASGDTTVIGGRQTGAIFKDVPFHGEQPTWRIPINSNQLYALAVALRLYRLKPALAEVYNRPEIALTLARLLPRLPISLVFQNDPQGMRGARSPTERAALLNRLAGVTCASEFLRRRFMQDVAMPTRRSPAVLHNAISMEALPPPRPRERLILFAGRIVREKAPDSFVAACASALPYLPGWRAEMIGADRFRADSPETEFARLTRAAADGAGVRTLGYRDHDAVLEAMASAAIVVMPSRWDEPFGLVALEALASGAALICSDRGGLPEVGGDVAIYVDPDDPAALAQAIRALAADPARRAALEIAGRDRARQFDAKIVATRQAELRQQAIAAAQ